MRATDEGVPRALSGYRPKVSLNGDPEPIHIEDTDTSFAIGWKGQYRIEGQTFVYVDGQSGRVTAIFGYPTHKLAQLK